MPGTTEPSGLFALEIVFSPQILSATGSAGYEPASLSSARECNLTTAARPFSSHYNTVAALTHEARKRYQAAFLIVSSARRLIFAITLTTSSFITGFE